MSYYDTWERSALRAARPHEALTAKARALLASLDPFTLEAIAEAAISLLDEMRDPDEDQCPAGDDGCGAFCGGEHGGVHWGSKFEGESDFAPVPEYGDDQREILGRFGVAFHVH